MKICTARNFVTSFSFILLSNIGFLYPMVDKFKGCGSPEATIASLEDLVSRYEEKRKILKAENEILEQRVKHLLPACEQQSKRISDLEGQLKKAQKEAMLGKDVLGMMSSHRQCDLIARRRRSV